MTAIRNKKNILAIAKLIEALPEEKFDMTDTTRSCGSPSCIAGWAAWEQHGDPWKWGSNDLISSALEFFSITEEEEQDRVMRHLFRGDYSNVDNAALTKEDAVEALREYARSGGIVWPDFDS